ncbi:hypothetical protein SDC9_65775 [bioreactor metagenome]|uniref:RHS repeat-associated core domain-containing protein n=1 Tax=bioreactor metagenome TaxID=1076179 RepID=A0A644XT03_9ZZZZ
MKRLSTQHSYFDARYYDSDLSVWLSVDPMSDEYPYQSPYMYCSGNPVMRIDPNGMWDDEIGINDKGEIVYYKQKAGADELYRVDENGNKVDVNGDGKMTEGTDYITFNKDDIKAKPKA